MEENKMPATGVTGIEDRRKITKQRHSSTHPPQSTKWRASRCALARAICDLHNLAFDLENAGCSPKFVRRLTAIENQLSELDQNVLKG